MKTAFQLVKFASVGLLNTGVGVGVIFLTKWHLGFGDVVANLTGYSIGIIISFLLNSRLTFSFSGRHSIAFVRFIVAMGLAYMLNLVTVLTAIHYFHLNSDLSQLLGAPPYVLFSFLMSRYWVFAEQATEREPILRPSSGEQL